MASSKEVTQETFSFSDAKVIFRPEARTPAPKSDASKRTGARPTTKPTGNIAIEQ